MGRSPDILGWKPEDLVVTSEEVRVGVSQEGLPGGRKGRWRWGWVDEGDSQASNWPDVDRRSRSGLGNGVQRKLVGLHCSLSVKAG